LAVKTIRKKRQQSGDKGCMGGKIKINNTARLIIKWRRRKWRRRIRRRVRQ